LDLDLLKIHPMKANHFILIFGLLLFASTGFAQKAISPDEFQTMLNGRAAVQLVDVRTPGEFAGGNLQGSMNMDFRSSEFSQRIEKLDKSEPVFIYCLSGGRSASAARKMASMGFSEVYDMKGGIMSWKRAGLPVSTGTTEKRIGTTKAVYDKMVNADVPVLVNIYAPWCGPCRKMKPMLEELNKSASGKYKYVKLNADDNDSLLKELGVAEIPTFFIYKNGKETWKHIGLIEKETLTKELGL
jgi:thioredoxin 1